jgi:cytidine deaminase
VRRSSSEAGPEIFIGLVGAVGTDLEALTEAITNSLKEVSYTTSVVKLSQLLQGFPKWKGLPLQPEDDRIREHMKAGSEFREILARGDALAAYSIGEIRNHREDVTGNIDKLAPRHAYVLRSLKHPDEAAFLKRVYGQYFFLVGAYSPRDDRLSNLAHRIAESRGSIRAEDFEDKARELNRIDEEETDAPLGQNVRGTFPLADVFVDTREKTSMRQAIERFIQILFGHPFHTPTEAEYGMFIAKAAALRSAALPRQVGAAIASENGDVVAMGTNEVPKFLGGLYWPGDSNDGRDFKLGFDVSDRMKRNSLSEILNRLSWHGWIARDKEELDPKDRVQEAMAIMKGTQLMKTIEFIRAVHAEVAAILNAGLHGISVKGCTLYTTTFPCHDCARHIVASGIRRVIYIEPYPKSLAVEFHEDSIAVDQVREPCDRVNFKPFVGIAPRRYMEFFDIGQLVRKKDDGQIIDWNSLKYTAAPKLIDIPPIPPIYLAQEKAELARVIEECGRGQLLEYSS